MADFHAGTTLKCGYLHKRSDYRREWRKRYFQILTGDVPRIQYYRDFSADYENPTAVEALVGAEITAVSQSDNFYHFTLQLAAPHGGGGWGSKPVGRSWILGCYTNDERREWLESIFNAKLPSSQQIWTNPLRSPEHSGLSSTAADHASAPPAASAGSAGANGLPADGQPHPAATAAAAAARALRRCETDASFTGTEYSSRSAPNFTYPLPAAASVGARPGAVSPELPLQYQQPHQQQQQLIVRQLQQQQQHRRAGSDLSDAVSQSNVSIGKGQMIGFGNGPASRPTGNQSPFSRSPSMMSRTAAPWAPNSLFKGLASTMSYLTGQQQPADWDARSHTSDMSYMGGPLPTMQPAQREAQPLGPSQEPLMVLLAALQGPSLPSNSAHSPESSPPTAAVATQRAAAAAADSAGASVQPATGAVDGSGSAGSSRKRGSGSGSGSSSSKNAALVEYLTEAYERALQYVRKAGIEGQEQLQALEVG
eukprot:GHUV01036663.1.p1 GENE.GHUV01036663.1~~GHUV01036663.1.p1  ORF type:complete len:481 (+),score=164.59 GHUV01036663.1:745-2187(+)